MRNAVQNRTVFFCYAVFVKFVVLEKSQKPDFSPYNAGFIDLFGE